MSDTAEPISGEPADAPAEPADTALTHVVDDETSRLKWLEWTAAQLIGGMTFEAAGEALVKAGWSPEAAEGIVEEARVATRDIRGVKTRDAVADEAEEHYRKTINSARYFLLGIPLVYFAAKNLIRSFKRIWTAKPSEKAEPKP